MRCVRVKADAANCYLEYRAPSAAASPYLVLAGLAAAGAAGLDAGEDLAPAGDHGAALPTCLPDALAALKADAVLCEALGQDLVDWFCLVKAAEVEWIAKKTVAFEKEGLDADAATQAAWNAMYFEYV